MGDIYEWRIYCLDEQKFVTWYRAENDPPTTCANNSNHQINPDSVTNLRKIGPNNIQVTDSSPDHGYVQMTSIKIEVPASTVPQTINVNKTYPFDMYLWEMSLAPSLDSLGDEINVQVGPDTLIGALTQSADIGTTTINASATVFNVLCRGSEIGISDGVNTEYPGLITGLDPSNGTVTFETPLLNVYAPGSTILFSMYPVRHLFCDSIQRLSMGRKGLKTKLIPANTPIRLIYIDNTPNTNPTTVYFQVEYYHA